MSLLEFLYLLKKNLALVIILPVLFALATGFYCWKFMVDQYATNVSLYVLTYNDEVISQNQNLTSGDMSLSVSIANDISVLASSARVLSAAAEDIGMTSLAGYHVSVEQESSGRCISMTVTGTNPEQIANVANSVANQTAKLSVEIMDVKAVKIIDPAYVPTAPYGPDREKYVVIAFVVGLLLAIGLVVLFDLLNTSIRSSRNLEEDFNLPVLGRIPYTKELD